MKQNLIKIGLVASLMIIFSGCTKKADYEDKDLTKTFLENNKNKLKKIYKIRSIRVSYTGVNKDIFSTISESFIDSIILSLNFKSSYISGCNYILFIDSNSVEFSQDDIIEYGKEKMYKEAQKCLDSAITSLEQEKLDKRISDYKKEISLNKKFDENSVKEQ